MASSQPTGDVGSSSLHHAAFFGQLDRVKRFVKEVESTFHGESVGLALGRIKDSNGNTALHCAALGGRSEICEYLIKDLKIDTEVTNVEDSTALYEAIIVGHVDTAVCLLENDANPNVRCKRGLTALHIASKQQGSQKLMQLLISKGAKVNATTPYCGTALFVAASVGEKDAIKILLDNHADPNVSDKNMGSPLGAAIHVHSIECVKLLLQSGADPNKYLSSLTPLEKAVGENQTEIIKCLLAAGANPDARNACDMTPLEVAAVEGLHECVLVLFPVTAPMAGVTDWSPVGIMKYGQTNKAKRKLEKKRKEEFLLSKSKGEAAVRRNDYVEALQHYTECLNMEPSDATILSNRSLCWAKLNLGNQALSDAQACISLRPDWPKAYYREGVAWNMLEDLKRAADSFFTAWQLDKENEELKSIYYAARQAHRRSNRQGQRASNK